jgi:predicted GNAT superfamily acetyltransferase
LYVRFLASGDYEGVHALDLATQREYRGEAWDGLSEDEQKALLWTSAEDFPLHLASGMSFVAEEDGAIVGFLIVFVEPVMKDPQVYVEGIAVAATHRRRGIATALYAALREVAKARGVTKLLADISLDNEASQKLHAKQGFVLTQRIEARLDL